MLSVNVKWFQLFVTFFYFFRVLCDPVRYINLLVVVVVVVVIVIMLNWLINLCMLFKLSYLVMKFSG